jgi:hypothetical protein
MKKLVAKKVDLKLADSFVSEVDVYIKKMTKEINYRQMLLDIEAQEAAEKAAKKAKAKKK